MTFDPIPYNLPLALLTFVIAFVAVATISLIVGLVVSLLSVGTHGPGLVWETIQRGWRDMTSMSWRRISAVSSLTIKESTRKKAFSVLVIFLILFLFAGFFLGGDNQGTDAPAKQFIVFVLTTIRWMMLPVALLLSCWGLPTDIKDRSLHTVVTKPVRRGEIVLGRMLGYGGVVTLCLLVMGIGGYLWIIREVPAAAQNQLVSRVPVYGDVQFIDRNGDPSATGKGINVGDIWEFRSYIEGVTKASMTWTFKNLDVESLASEGKIRLENRFEAFRSYKGLINEPVRYKLTLVNNSNGLRVTNGDLVRGVAEFAQERVQKDPTKSDFIDETDTKYATAYRIQPTAVVEIPRKISYLDIATGANKEVDLFSDVIDKGTLTVEVTCPDAQQYIGAARSDLFIRLPDRPFASTYFKSVFMLWLMLMLVCMIGATASTFVKGPVATLLTISLVILGALLRPDLEKMVTDYTLRGSEGVLGGGAIESFYRLITQMNQQSPLPDNFGSTLIKWIDTGIFEVLRQMRHIIPNFSYFNTAEYSANGFDVSWDAAILPGIATALAYIIPCLLIGYFSLQLRELEAK